MYGQLNSFQKTMLQWNDLHPYSAVHVVQVSGSLDESRLKRTLQFGLQKRGLTNLAVDRGHSSFSYGGGESRLDLQIVPGGQEPHLTLFTEMERQLNLPFDQASPFNPFRFFAIPAPDFFLLGLTYFHAVADAESIVLLLKELADAYHGKLTPEPPPRLNLYPDAKSHLLSRHPRVLLQRLLSLPSQVRGTRQSHRPRYCNHEDMSNGFSFFSLEPERMRGLLAAKDSWGVTVNDLLLALLMKSLSPLANGRGRERVRRKISIGCIVNIRRDLKIDSSRTFGLFLGSFTVNHEVPDSISSGDLARAVAQQTLATKQKKLYLGTSLELGFARFMFRFFAPAARRKFYPKNYPLWGGITNMNLNSLWGQSGDDMPINYYRGVSTGPATPLVFSVSTVRNVMNIGVSYRSTVFSPQDIQDLKLRFMEHLEHLKERA